MIKIGILGDIGSGKSFVAKEFGYPVFNADYEVSKLYQQDKKIFKKLKKILPKYIDVFPINKNQITDSILSNKSNLKKIVKIVHSEVRKRMWLFIKKNKNKKVLVFDIPLLLENKISDKSFVLVFVDSKKSDILKRLKNRPNYNKKLLEKFKKIQFSLEYKKRKSQFVIKNKFSKKSVKTSVNSILKKIL
tara:strand:- start:733 stop:1302 length:570 start_codon:yes stop_codon:yes gene_type:complete